uniref:hypothetical protein n=1 Tax=Candidatus Stercorousia sp. TaxID=3048886 RepID=UPI00402742F0
MSVSNVYNQSKINAIKLNLGVQAKKASANKPAYMQMTGSIFDAPGVKNSATATANSLNDLNTSKSLSELNASGETTGSSKSSTEDIKSIDNAADGKAAAASAESSADEVESLTKDTQNDQKTVEKYDSDAQKLDKQIEKDDKKFQTQLKKQENDLKKDTQKLEKLVKESEEAQTEVDNAQNELDSLLGSASFSINRDPNSGEATNPNQDRINELQTIIGANATLLQSNGQQIYSLQRSSSRTITKMTKTNANYVKVNQQNSKAITQNQSKTDKVIETATSIEQISALVSQTGQAVNYAGKGLVALGATMSSNPFTAAVGAALISTGNVMQKVGTVVEMVGNYGQMAANVTKTAAYAADGNLAGALTSAASAIQTGAAAVNTTTNLNKTFKEIDKQATQATQKLAANTAARETVKDMSTEELGGMSKKQARKATAAKLQAQMADGTISTDAKWAKGQLNDLTEQITSVPKDGTSIAQQALNSSKTQFADAVTSAGGSIKDGVVSGLDKKAKKEINNKVKTGFTNTATDTVKSSKKFDWGKLANGLQATAAKLGSQNTQQTTQNTTKPAPAQWDLSSDSKFQKIYNYNRRYA